MCEFMETSSSPPNAFRTFCDFILHNLFNVNEQGLLRFRMNKVQNITMFSVPISRFEVQFQVHENIIILVDISFQISDSDSYLDY